MRENERDRWSCELHSLSQHTTSWHTLPQWPCSVISQHRFPHRGEMLRVSPVFTSHSVFLLLSPVLCWLFNTHITFFCSDITHYQLSLCFFASNINLPPSLPIERISNIMFNGRPVGLFLVYFLCMCLLPSAGLINVKSFKHFFFVHSPAFMSFPSSTSHDALGLFPVSGFSHHSHCSRPWHISKQRTFLLLYFFICNHILRDSSAKHVTLMLFLPQNTKWVSEDHALVNISECKWKLRFGNSIINKYHIWSIWLMFYIQSLLKWFGSFV